MTRIEIVRRLFEIIFSSLRFSACLTLVFGPRLSMGHHSLTAVYEIRQTMALTGELLTIDWRNPHIYIEIRVDEEDGGQIWRLEGSSPGFFRNDNSVRSRFEDAIGKAISVEAHPSRSGEKIGALVRVSFPDRSSVEVVPCC